MADTNAAVAPAATSWAAVLGGWVATIGASVIFAPLVAGLLAALGAPNGGSDIAVAVPVVFGILLSYIVGGYIAGRMAGYRTSWHGLMTAFFSLLVLLLALLVGAMADRGVFAGSGVRSLADIVPGVRDLNIDSFGNAVSFGAILGFLAAIFGGWLGGVLAPTQRAFATSASTLRATPATTRDRVLGGRVVKREPVRDAVRERDREKRVRGPMLPSFGRKGGDRVEESDVPRDDASRDVDEVHTTRVERPED
jgi:hypothetical protein